MRASPGKNFDASRRRQKKGLRAARLLAIKKTEKRHEPVGGSEGGEEPATYVTPDLSELRLGGRKKMGEDNTWRK